ncbi:tubulin polyglutamylase ttll6-like isoform X4 [Littorina saxatilis]|uniref:tubulin polyglutamylase ttll6-like isoform X4 n=1 Tax=Littorina saxatilis TaxID=31220 RepID=UPI0038B443DE
MDTDRDDLASSSSSESETEADEDEYQAPTGNSAEELTLQDDERSVLLLAPPEDEDLGEGEAGPEDQDTQYEEEGEGEGAEEPPLGQTPDSIDKKELDKKKKKKKKKKFLYICLTNCKYDVVRRTARRFGFKEVSDDEDWSLYWTDFSVALERVMDMKKYQKINHFPGMNEICRKDLLARNLNRMMKMFPKEYNIFPKTWCLPADYGDFQAYTRQKKNKTYILKPESGCQGRGIWITKNPKDIKPHEHMICQVYTNKPFLIDGFKFDFRIYTLVTSCDPLRIFVFKDGLARFATNKYCEPTHNNTENVFMHLTNYAINKNSEDFVRDDEAGSKRRISTINRYLQGKGIDVDKMWTDIDDTIIKTLISAHSVLKHNYRTCFPNHVRGSACFEILGFDVLLDRKLRPYVIEVNHSPSFGTDAQLDREIKGTLIWDTLGLINFGAVDRRRCLEEERRRIKDRLLGKNTKKETKEELEVAQQQYLEQLERYESNHMGNFRRIFPIPGCEKYDKFFHSSGTLFQETAAFRARSELARQQREEILRKKEKMELMLKKGKRGEGGVRPESPTWRRKRPVWHRNPTIPFKPRLTSHSPHDDRGYSEEAVDTQTPMDILEEEELERISGLLQRDNLVRGLGIVEHVYRLLHCTPGTVGIVKPDPKPQPLSLIRPKDRMYYCKLLDRYFGANHALSNDIVDSCSTASTANTGSGSSGVNRTANASGNMKSSGRWLSGRTEGGGDEGGGRAGGGGGGGRGRGGSRGGGGGSGKAVRVSLQQFPYAHHCLTYKGHNNNADNHSAASSQCDSVSDLDSELDSEVHSSCRNEAIVLLSLMGPHPGVPGSQRWPIKSKSLGNINERTVPAYQERYFEKGKGYNWQYRRNKMARKPMTGAGVGARGGVVVQESDLRSMSGMVDTEAERNRLLARSGYNYHQPSYSQAQSQAHQGYTSSGYQSDWRSDSSTPARTRVLSAHLQQRESEGVGVTRFITQHPSHGLSVVSAPAPVVQRPDIGSPSNPLHRRTPPVRITGLDAMNTTRSTKSQRIRGASNTMRLRQMEMRENHAFAFS